MITVEEREAIRRAYYLEGKSKWQIAREHKHSRRTVDKAVDTQPPQPYRLSKAKPSPVFGAFRARADELLAENVHLPPKQQYTGHKLYELLQAEGYQGSEARVRLHMTQWTRPRKPRPSFCPWSLSPAKMRKWIGERPLPALVGSSKRCRCLSCGCPTADDAL